MDVFLFLNYYAITEHLISNRHYSYQAFIPSSYQPYRAVIVLNKKYKYNKVTGLLVFFSGKPHKK